MGLGIGFRCLECRILGAQIVERDGIGFFCFFAQDLDLWSIVFQAVSREHSNAEKSSQMDESVYLYLWFTTPCRASTRWMLPASVRRMLSCALSTVSQTFRQQGRDGIPSCRQPAGQVESIQVHLAV